MIINGKEYLYLVRDAEGRYKRPTLHYCDALERDKAERYKDYQTACNMAKLMNVQIEIEVL